jgi:hypothetical protein
VKKFGKREKFKDQYSQTLNMKKTFLKIFYYAMTDVLYAIYHEKSEQTESQYHENK